MDRAEAIKRLALGMMQCGMLMPIEWVKENGKGSEFDEALQMAIAALREQESAENAHCNEWISVKERLPEDDVDVLTRRATGMSVESHCGFGWLYDEYNGRWVVTHWMPLPEPPKEGADHEAL